MNNEQQPQHPLIPVTEGKIGSEKMLVVDARTLHSFVGSDQKFTDWIKNRIQEYDFSEGIDFLLHKNMKQTGQGSGNRLLTKTGEQELKRGGHNRVEYTLSISMAKELAMVERNAMGRKVRRYFIECERKLYETLQQKPKPTDDIDIEARLLNIFNHRTLFWAIEKRDLIAQPGINKEVLYSVMLDIQDSLSDELNKDLAKALRERKITNNKEDWIKFIKRWVPIYFRNTTKSNILKLVTSNDELNKE